MSLFDSISFDDFDPRVSKRAPSGLANLAECVNPQYTVKRCGTTQHGFVTPEPSPTDTTPRRESFALSVEDGGTYYSGSSGSSYTSHSGCGAPSQLTPGSSAATSRRQSVMIPESQYYLSAISSSPSIRPQGPKKAAATDQFSLQQSPHGSYFASTDTASLTTDGTAGCEPGGPSSLARQWESYDASSLYEREEQPVQIDEPTDWRTNIALEYDNLIAAQVSPTLDVSQPLFGGPQATIFGRAALQPNAEAYNAAGNNAPSLGPPFAGYPGKWCTDIELIDADVMTSDAIPRHSYPDSIPGRQPLNDSSHHTQRSRSALLKHYNTATSSDDDMEYVPVVSKDRKRRPNQSQRATCKAAPSSRPHVYGMLKREGQRCDYKCNRPERLKRHQLSVHAEFPEMHPCAFDGCKDRKTGRHREILARSDNLRAHYTKTHFRYGSSEKGGKNERKSMKAAHDMGLHEYDDRWTLLLEPNENVEPKMNVNHEIKDFLHVWKMLGYSILETRDIKVKDVAPDWEGSEDATLQRFDPRWRALWDKTLTYEKTLTRGKDMQETEAQGLLGVTMLETEAMGIDHLDPRWIVMLRGGMSVEQSEKLGVKHRNPMWKEFARRRAR